VYLVLVLSEHVTKQRDVSCSCLTMALSRTASKNDACRLVSQMRQT